MYMLGIQLFKQIITFSFNMIKVFVSGVDFKL